MDLEAKKYNFKMEVYREMIDNILPFWEMIMKDSRGGYFGRIDGNGKVDLAAPKGAILNSRIMWAFSAMFGMSGADWRNDSAERAKNYIEKYLIDKDYGGIFWSVNADGTPLDTKKQFYALGFALYAFSEFGISTGDQGAKERALEFFELIEKYSKDKEFGGYLEAATQDWKPIEDMRLSEKDDNSAKSMNTHLHILEPYTNLLRIYPENKKIRKAVEDLINIFFDKIEDPHTHHLGLFFDKDWTRRDNNISYGHEIEASWLLLEAAQVLGAEKILKKTLEHTRHIALAGLEGRCTDGSMVYERYGNGHYDNEKHWWVQAENVIGQLYLWKYHDMPEMLDKAIESWVYIRDNIVDREKGEWVWSRRGKEINREDDKAGFWKCPYHNTRMCLKVIELTEM